MKTGSFLLLVPAILGFWAINGVQSKVECWPDWWGFQDNCYYFSHHMTGRKTWYEARADCSAMCANLLIIRNIEERYWLEYQFPYGNSHSWIGLTDEGVEGDWKWIDGTPLTPEIAHWAVGQPNGTKNENCAELSALSWGRLHDNKCTNKQAYICKRGQGEGFYVYNQKGACKIENIQSSDVFQGVFGNLNIGDIITVQGQVKQNAMRFAVSLFMNNDKDVALRMGADVNIAEIELFNRIGSDKWSKRFIPMGPFPFVVGSNFVMTIEFNDNHLCLAVGDNYKVEFDNQGYILTDIKKIAVDGDVTVRAVRKI